MMAEYIMAAWLLSCAHLGWDDPANPAPEHPLKYSRMCHPLGPQLGIETHTIVSIIGTKYPGWCVMNTSETEVGYVAVSYFHVGPDGEANAKVEMGAGVKPCMEPVS